MTIYSKMPGRGIISMNYWPASVIYAVQKVFYRKVLEIYALSIDYDPRTSITQKFFKTVQNKMHFAAPWPHCRRSNL